MLVFAYVLRDLFKDCWAEKTGVNPNQSNGETVDHGSHWRKQQYHWEWQIWIRKKRWQGKSEKGAVNGTAHSRDCMSLNNKELEITNWKMESSLQQRQKIMYKVFSAQRSTKNWVQILSILKNLKIYCKKKNRTLKYYNLPQKKKKGITNVLGHAQFHGIHGTNMLRWSQEVIHIPCYRERQRRRPRQHLTSISRTVDSCYPSFFSYHNA